MTTVTTAPYEWTKKMSVTVPVSHTDGRTGETIYADLVISIDVGALAEELGPSAMKNKSHKSLRFGDAIVSKAINFRGRP